MPIIIDTNCLANVFSKSSKNHSDFEPIFNWIINGKGTIVYGGSKYSKELRQCTKYLRIINLLKDKGKVFVGNGALIDKYEKENKRIFPDKVFDDPHLAAIVKNTKCRIICSLDTTSIPFVTSPKLYPKRFSLPVYYTSVKNEDLLCDKYVDSSLKPLCKLKKEHSAELEVLSA